MSKEINVNLLADRLVNEYLKKQDKTQLMILLSLDEQIELLQLLKKIRFKNA